MDWNAILNEALKAVITVAIPVASVAAGWAWMKVQAWIDANVTNQTLLRIAHEAEVVVGALGQSVGGPLKEGAADGKLTDEEKQRIKSAAIDCLKTRLADLPSRFITDAKLHQAIENAVGAAKAAPAPKAEQPPAPLRGDIPATDPADPINGPSCR